MTARLAWLLFASVLICGAACGQDGAERDLATDAADDAASVRDADPGPLGALGGDPAPFAPAPPGTLACEGLLNGDFSWIADGTTAPPKYGAYWRGAFVPEPGVPDDRVEATERGHALALREGEPPVVQKIVADERWSALLGVRLAWRGAPGAVLRVTLRDGPGRTLTRRLAADDDGLRRVALPLGADFAEEHGAPPVPRLELELAAESGELWVHGASARVVLPSPELAALEQRLADHIVRSLEKWWLPPEEGGLGLVDRSNGRVLADQFDVISGEVHGGRRQYGFHTIHNLLIHWLHLAPRLGRHEEVARWTPLLERSMRRVLDEHFGEHTALPFNRDARTGRPIDDQAVPVASWIDLLLDAREVVADEALADELLDQARRTADTLVALARLHDRDPERFPNDFSLDRASGVLEGSFPNWFGHMPNKFTARGQLDTPRRYNTAWAVVTGRTFWYHLLESPAAVMRVHALRPAEHDLPTVLRALQRYERPWDAARYDLENDTDDHYGYLVKDGLVLLESARRAPDSPDLRAVIQRAEELLRGATDHRLEPHAATPGDTLWIQAVRLGTACAGDSPRAFKGVVGLLEHRPDHPAAPLQRAALLELAANDWKGRQLTNGQFTESFFKLWEMVCICFFGTYQGDCRERPLDEWQGDVGDIFGGPPMSSLAAQLWAWKVAEPHQRPAILARFATILDVSERDLLREHGFLFGLDPAIARQYELPEKYTLGLQSDTPAGLGTVMSLARALEVFLDG